MKDKARPLLNRIFLVLFVLGMAVIVAAVCGAAGRPVLWLAGCALAVGWWALMAYGVPAMEKLPGRVLVAVFYVLAAGMLVFQLIYGRGYSAPRGDYEAIYTGVREAVQFGHLTDSTTYFLQYQHQRGMLMVLFLYNYILRVTGIQVMVSVYGNIILACVCVTGAVVLGFHTAQRLWGTARAFCCGVLMLTFVPFYTYIRNVYSNTVGILFISLAVFFYVMGRQSGHKIIKWVFLAIGGGAFAMASAVIGIANVLVVAVGIHLFLTTDLKGFLLRVGALILGFAVVYAGFQLALRHSGIMDFTGEEERLFPVQYWIMVGQQDGGYYVEEEYQAMATVGGYEERVAYANAQIARELAARTPGQQLAHQFAKTRMCFGYQTYITEDIPWLRNVCDARQVMLMVLYLAGGVVAFFKDKGKPGWHTVFQLLVFGLFLFFQVWEVKSDNLFGLMPLLCIGAAAMPLPGKLGRFYSRRRAGGHSPPELPSAPSQIQYKGHCI